MLNGLFRNFEKLTSHGLNTEVGPDPVTVVGDRGEAVWVSSLAASGGTEGGHTNKLATLGDEGSARVAVARSHAASGVNANLALPVAKAVVVRSNLVIKDGDGHLPEDGGDATANKAIANLAPAGSGDGVSYWGLELSQVDGLNELAEDEGVVGVKASIFV